MCPSDTKEMKRENRQRALRCIFSCKKISQRELSARLGLSWPTIWQNVKELQEQGFVKEVGMFESTGGRRARAFAPVRDMALTVGIDITRRHIGLVLLDLSGQIVMCCHKERPFFMGEEYRSFLHKAVQELLAAAGYKEERVVGAGISLPGIVETDGKTLAYSHALELADIPAEQLTGSFPFPCLYVNDANAAGFAEIWGQEQQDMIYLSLSSTVGGAIFYRGELYMGDHRRGGEFGHHTLVPGGRTCYCGKSGCLDAYCSASVLAARTGGSLEAFFNALKKGDPSLQALWEEYLDWLAIEINNLRMTFDCPVILGGYVGAYLEGHEKTLLARLRERNTFEVDASYLRLCRYRQEAAAVGAALMQVEEYVSKI